MYTTKDTRLSTSQSQSTIPTLRRPSVKTFTHANLSKWYIGMKNNTIPKASRSDKDLQPSSSAPCSELFLLPLDRVRLKCASGYLQTKHILSTKGGKNVPSPERTRSCTIRQHMFLGREVGSFPVLKSVILWDPWQTYANLLVANYCQLIADPAHAMLKALHNAAYTFIKIARLLKLQNAILSEPPIVRQQQD